MGNVLHILRLFTPLLAAFLITAIMSGCGDDGNKPGTIVAAEYQPDKDALEADKAISAANQQVLNNEVLLSLQDRGDVGEAVRYFLPFEKGKHRGVSQGINGSYSHKGRIWHAIDWNLPGYSDYRLPVVTAAPGTVVLARMLDLFGNCVVMRHFDGSKTRYAHLDEITVALGQSVGQAEKIGLVGTTGHSTGPHLHFEILDAQMNGMFPVFAEQIATPVGDTPCTTQDDTSGCYESENTPPPHSQLLIGTSEI